MAHKQKYTKGAVGHMFQHYDRTKTVPELECPENTCMNYNLADADQPKRQLDFLHQRLSEIKVLNRKDVNVMVDWVVTLPQSLKNNNIDDEQRFFKETYKFLNDRYGKENVISAYVHKDEITPHMHYAFVPVVEDKKKGGYKLSAKEAITRQDLRTFHKDLSDHMKSVFGYDIGILNEATQKGNKSIEELKRGTAKEKMDNIYKNTRILTDKTNKLKKDIEIAENKKQALERQIDALQVRYDNLQVKYDNRQMKIKDILEIKPEQEKGLFGVKDSIKGVSISDIENLKKLAIQGLEARQKLKDLMIEYEKVKKAVPTMEERMKSASEKIRLKELERAFKRLPEDIQEEILKPPTKGKNKSHELKNDLMKLEL